MYNLTFYIFYIFVSVHICVDDTVYVFICVSVLFQSSSIQMFLLPLTTYIFRLLLTTDHLLVFLKDIERSEMNR
jgi:hypothetical protein